MVAEQGCLHCRWHVRGPAHHHRRPHPGLTPLGAPSDRFFGVNVVGFDHVVLRVADVERSLAWYHDELGLELERVDAWRRGEILFPSVRVDPTTVIDLLLAERTGQNVDHVCLVIAPEDLDA
ncbi:MAG: VOC family protein, partial [Actinobacteria bacterium]|nr:VOC family protein [Actinomycetota bacterium]